MNTYPSSPLSYDLEEGSKTGLPAKNRLGAFGWRRTINDTYFDLQVSFVQPQSFFGSLNQVGLDQMGVSYYHANTVHYKRELITSPDPEQSVLITFPISGKVSFSQHKRDLTSGPGAFFIELSHLPYEFYHNKEASLYVIKIPLSLLTSQVSQIEREFARSLSLESGVGRLLFFQITHIINTINQYELTDIERHVLEQQLLNLLVLHLSSPTEALMSSNTDVKSTHLKRIESYVYRNLHNPDLSPATVAKACHVSVRYLHKLFKEAPYSYSEWVKSMRLKQAHQLLRSQPFLSIYEIAQKVGYGDQSYFSRIYKKHFGYSPKDTIYKQWPQKA